MGDAGSGTHENTQWSDSPDLNREPPTWKDGALPIELLSHETRVAGIEPGLVQPERL